MANGKWITNLQADTPLDDAARRVLTVRFQVVLTHLPRALHRWTEDPEHVHQLRVGTRRAGAGLSVFACCLPKTSLRESQHRLRDLRRAAGAARDWDVFSIGLLEREPEMSAVQRPGLDFLQGYAQAERHAAQAALVASGDKTSIDWPALVAGTISDVRKPKHKKHGRVLRDLAKPWLGLILSQLYAAAAERHDDYERLHQVRILGKRLRYGMEIFASCFGPEFRTHYYPLVEDMQEILGDANDSHVAGQRLSPIREYFGNGQPGLWKRLRPGVEGVIRFHQRRLVEQRGRFFKWLARWHKSGTEAALRDLVEKS